MVEPISDEALLIREALAGRGQQLGIGLQLLQPYGLRHAHHLIAQQPGQPCAIIVVMTLLQVPRSIWEYLTASRQARHISLPMLLSHAGRMMLLNPMGM